MPKQTSKCDGQDKVDENEDENSKEMKIYCS